MGKKIFERRNSQLIFVHVYEVPKAILWHTIVWFLCWWSVSFRGYHMLRSSAVYKT